MIDRASSQKHRLDVDLSLEANEQDLSGYNVLHSTNRTGDAELFITDQSTIQGIAFTGKSWTIHCSPAGDFIDLSISTSLIQVQGWDGNDRVIGSNGRDYMDGEYGNDSLYGGDGNDFIWGGYGNDTIHGGNGDDKLTGWYGNDLIYGDNGNDIIDENRQGHTIYGGAGDDTISVSKGHGLIAGNSGNDIVTMVGGVHTVMGGSGDDIIVLHGIKAVTSADIRGDSGNDIFAFWGKSSADEITFHGGEGADILRLSGTQDFSGIQVDGIETLQLTGTDFFPIMLTIDAATLGSFNAIDVNRGANLDIRLAGGGSFTMNFARHVPLSGTIHGSLQDDHIDLNNTSTEWSISGGLGDDMIISGRKTNSISGGAGNDRIELRGTSDQAYGSTGNDTLIGYSSTDDILNGGSGNDTLIGNGKEGYLNGGSGNDILVAGAGLNYLHASQGRDTLVFTDMTGGAIVYNLDKSYGQDDVLDFSSVSTIKNFSDLVNKHAENIDGGLLITYGSSQVAIAGISMNHLHESCFIF
jgi:Ca2+-binding RTX toxin-like protein